MTRFYLHGGAYHVASDGAALPAGAAEVPRLPDDGEAWNGSAFVFDGAAILAAAHAAIDAQAEAVRAQFITAAPGQAMTYLQKEAEARAWAANPATLTPILAGEAEAMGVTIAALAADVIANADAWGLIGGKIEGARRAAKRAATEATDAAGIRAATNINWPGVINGD